MSQDRKDGEAGDETCQTVANGNYQCISEIRKGYIFFKNNEIYLFIGNTNNKR